MLGIIGTYRGMDYVPDLLSTIDEHVSGLTELVFVDDSGNAKIAKELSKYGEVVVTESRGYNSAMQTITKRAQDEQDHVAFIEEDFIFTGAVDFTRLAAHLDAHPYLAQVILQRDPWFDAEKEYDSIIEFHKKTRRQIFRDVDGFWEHNAFFSCNPGVWSRATWAAGWPTGDWSEDQKRLSTLKARKKFALSKNVVIEHRGIRSGTGY